jgi:hypothetical protein
MIPQKAGDVGRSTAAACRPECEELTFENRLEATLRLPGFLDGERFEGTQRLSCDMTIRAGQVVFDFNERAATPFHETR